MNVDIEYKNEHCEGCASYAIKGIDILNNSREHLYVDGYGVCGYARNNEDGMCPCSQCIVKVMCVDPCDDYHSFKLHVDHIGL